MDKILYFLFGITGVFGFLFFDMKLITFIFFLLCVLGGIIFPYFSHKISNEFLRKAIKGAIFVISLIVIFASSVEYPEYGNRDLESRKKQIEKLLDKQEWEQVILEAETVEQLYGIDDSLVVYKTMALIGQNQYKDALKIMNQYSNYWDKEYFQMLEVLYLKMGEEYRDELFEIYVSAANLHPDWTTMQLNAGVSQMEMGRYGTAKYYLEKAYEAEPQIGEHSYYLGLVHYYLGNYEVSLNWFEQALKNNVSEEWKPFIKHYALEITDKLHEE